MSDPGQIVAVIGEDGVARLVSAFYRRVPDDPILAPLYPEHDFAGAEERLCSFLVYRLGGSQHYLTERGHPRLRLRHAPFAVDRAARDAWVARMDEALFECGFDSDVTSVLRPFFAHMATFLVNRA